MEETKKTVIECECGAHLLVVQSEVEYFPDTVSGKVRFRQEFDMAMFSIGNYSEKPGFWYKLGVMWRYFRTGKMHLDEIILQPSEAKKLVAFIEENTVESEKD
jgi:hypothetical protein